MPALNSVSGILCPWQLGRWPVTIRVTILISDSDWNILWIFTLGFTSTLKWDWHCVLMTLILKLKPIISKRSKISLRFNTEHQIVVLTSDFRPSDRKQLDWKEWQWILRSHITVNNIMAHKSQHQKNILSETCLAGVYLSLLFLHVCRCLCDTGVEKLTFPH